MKNIFKYIWFILPFIMVSCDDDIDEIVASEIAAPIILEADTNYIDLSPNYQDNPALTLVWSQADYNVQTVANYDVLFSLEENFENSLNVLNTSNRSYTWTVDQLNTAVQSLGMSPNMDGTLYVKVISSLGAQTQLAMESNVVSFVMSPYVTYSFNDYYLVGNALDINNDGELTDGGDWNNNAKNHAMFRNAENENLYRYTGKFGGNAYFKLLKTKGQWAPQWGGENDVLIPRPTDEDDDPPAIPVPGDEGYYTFTVNMDELTYNITPYTGDTNTTYGTIGLIGDATADGWDSDQDMVQNQYDPHQWQLEGVELGNGEVKFRADDAWDTSWGDVTAYSGTAVLGGPNIPVTSGTYNVYFNDLTGDYQLIPVE